MTVVESYAVAVVMCVITMLCWGSWANTQKLASKEWRFQLFYWDYAVGVFLLSLLLAFTLGSHGAGGRGFLADLHQADRQWLWSAFLGGIIFNLSNILLVAAIDIAGMAVAVNVSASEQVWSGVRVAEAHPSDVMAKPGPATMPAPGTTGPLPVFVTVTDCCALVVPSGCVPKSSAVGERLNEGSVPVPASATASGLLAALLGIDSVALWKPLLVGVKATATVQD